MSFQQSDLEDILGSSNFQSRITGILLTSPKEMFEGDISYDVCYEYLTTLRIAAQQKDSLQRYILFNKVLEDYKEHFYDELFLSFARSSQESVNEYLDHALERLNSI